MEKTSDTRTAGEAGWKLSRYNLSARIEGTDKVAIANLFRGTCGAYTPAELYLLDVLEQLPADHPLLERFAQRGLIVDFDELQALKALRNADAALERSVSLTICPTMGCNFDCPYCFEDHRVGRMTEEVQDQIVSLARRMLEAFGARRLFVSWFGGEPLLAPDVIARLSEKLIALSAEKGAAYGAEIITNGYLLDQRTADLLEKAQVQTAQITLDGLGSAHDATRHLAGGGPSFERITENLRKGRFAFGVRLRHNVHAGNRDQTEPLRRFAEQLAQESGNRIVYYAAPVLENTAAQNRGSDVQTLCASDSSALGLRRAAERFHEGHSCFCGASLLPYLGIDERGRLYKCWEDVDKPQASFGSAARWDPLRPVATADAPDRLTAYLVTALPAEDPECAECRWLPLCAGGCPNRRIYYGERPCLSYRDVPEQYVLALYERLKEEKGRPGDR